jgi:hypothetical protein
MRRAVRAVISDECRRSPHGADDFAAKTTEQLMRPDGKIGHTQLRVGDSMRPLT